ncbi:hypothetical protein PCCS19_38300 [Paenibacillus sp. CCS19]|uniref:CBO0543 family protein n=1 Tax=Paenibacillus sp. CCS19 TaxID=3158387 RepID=UPI00255E5B2B|nr:CBO0543 family protein [Paenibacillus cellulosilyticus]GMK40774.1 hypothetical protein PCCS19_38300 [Paenibacillus cellulosilyticus]
MSGEYPTFDEIKAVDHKLTEMREQYFYHHVLFSFQWWLLLVLIFVQWVIWWKLVDKARVKEILLYGAVLSIVIILLDDTGGELGLWSYPYQILMLVPRQSTIDLSVLPVFHMMVYQYFRSWKSFIIANVVMAMAFSFIAEPISVWLNIYDLDHWRYIYSFPLYIAKAVFVRWLIELIVKKLKKFKENVHA